MTLFDLEQQHGPASCNCLRRSLEHFQFVPLDVDLDEADVIEAVVIKSSDRHSNGFKRDAGSRETRESSRHRAGTRRNKQVSLATLGRQRHLMNLDLRAPESLDDSD